MKLLEKMSNNSIDEFSDFDEGDLGYGPSKFIDQEKMTMDEFYKSEKFFIGYNELQDVWAKPSSHDLNSEMYKRKQCLSLSLSEINRTKNYFSDESLNKDYPSSSFCSSDTSNASTPIPGEYSCFPSPYSCRYKSEVVETESLNSSRNEKSEDNLSTFGKINRFFKKIFRNVSSKRLNSPSASQPCNSNQVSRAVLKFIY